MPNLNFERKDFLNSKRQKTRVERKITEEVLLKNIHTEKGMN